MAFIWYLVPDSWDSQIDGGELQLFESQTITDDGNDENFFPTKISTTIPPKRNMFMFFEVSPRSFHQVTVWYKLLMGILGRSILIKFKK